MEYFVDKHSIVRQIWGKGDTILFIFAGASAEFALSKAVDWLYFTGKLPADPLGRLFTTVSYARAIVFSENEKALQAIETINKVHQNVEAKRGAKIPDWAYRDVLFMLIDYSIRSYELLERKLSKDEKEEVFDIFHRVGQRMHLKDLPQNFDEWEEMRKEHLQQNFENSKYSQALFRQYRKHLGVIRYKLLLEAQIKVVPQKVRELLDYRRISLIGPLLAVYRRIRNLYIGRLLKDLILPSRYKSEIKAMDWEV